MIAITEIQKKLQRSLKPDRYQHTVGVMYTAASLSMRYEGDIAQSMLAGLLHDCGKAYSIKEQMILCKKHNIHLQKTEENVPALIHAKLGAYLAEYEYHIKDKEIINAISCHTTGHPHMILLEKILYISDYIEPGRRETFDLELIRKVAFVNLDKAVAITAGATLSYLKEKGYEIDQMTVDTYNFYNKIV